MTQPSAASTLTPPGVTSLPALRPHRPLNEIALAIVPLTQGRVDFSGVEAMTREQAQGFMLGLLGAVQELGASDLHLSAGAAPFVRNMRALHPLSAAVLSAADSLKLNTCLLDPDELELFSRKHDYDHAFAMAGGSRIRANLMVHKDGVTGTYRIVPPRVSTPAELGFKNLDVIKRLLSYHNGLILVTGPVGAGKTTTLNALIDELNRSREDHIITVEDPIEFLHNSLNCNVTQRQAGHHTASFASALKGALREDPDIIVIGELRDLETIEMAISASETGHLVIGTMHTSDATTTLNRLLDAFPPRQQPQIRAMVAESLRGILCQRLLPARTGGVVLAVEILVNTIAVSAMIRDGKTQGILNALDTGRREGMISMDNAIFDLWHEKKIAADVAANNILNRLIRQSIPSSEIAAAAAASATTPPTAPTPPAPPLPAAAAAQVTPPPFFMQAAKAVAPAPVSVPAAAPGVAATAPSSPPSTSPAPAQPPAPAAARPPGLPLPPPSAGGQRLPPPPARPLPPPPSRLPPPPVRMPPPPSRPPGS